MNYEEYQTLCHQLAVLKEISKHYGGTIDNTIQQMESRKEWYERNVRKRFIQTSTARYAYMVLIQEMKGGEE